MIIQVGPNPAVRTQTTAPELPHPPSAPRATIAVPPPLKASPFGAMRQNDFSLGGLFGLDGLSEPERKLVDKEVFGRLKLSFEKSSPAAGAVIAIADLGTSGRVAWTAFTGKEQTGAAKLGAAIDLARDGMSFAEAFIPTLSDNHLFRIAEGGLRLCEMGVKIYAAGAASPAAPLAVQYRRLKPSA